MADENVGLLPLVELEGIQWLVDIEHRELRKFENPNHKVAMYSAYGRRMIQAMQGKEWRVFGVDRRPVEI